MRRERRRRGRAARRAVDGQRHLAAAERERLQHPGQAEVVVGVEVRDEDLLEVDEADRGAQQLALRPSPQSKSRRSPPRRTNVDAVPRPGRRCARRGAAGKRRPGPRAIVAPVSAGPGLARTDYVGPNGLRGKLSSTARPAARPRDLASVQVVWPAGSARRRREHRRRSAGWRSSRAFVRLHPVGLLEAVRSRGPRQEFQLTARWRPVRTYGRMSCGDMCSLATEHLFARRGPELFVLPARVRSGTAAAPGHRLAPAGPARRPSQVETTAADCLAIGVRCDPVGGRSASGRDRARRPGGRG